MPRPGEAVGPGGNNPRTGAVEFETALGRRRDLDRQSRVVRRRMGDRQNDDLSIAAIIIDNQQQGARPIFRAFLAALKVFDTP